MKLKVKESIIEVDPIKSNSILKLSFLLSIGKKRKSYIIKREFLEEILNETYFMNTILEKAGIFPYEKSEIKEK